MLRFLLPAALAAAAFAAEPVLELCGQLRPPGRASISLFGTKNPFTAVTLSDVTGRFSFKKLRADDYTVAVFIPGRGEARRTVEVGPAAADSHRRVSLTLDLKDSDFDLAAAVPQYSVSTTQLAIPKAALHEYLEAEKDLERHDLDAAVKRLENAVEMAPRFAAAWNELGTIAYQTRKFDRAEECPPSARAGAGGLRSPGQPRRRAGDRAQARPGRGLQSASRARPPQRRSGQLAAWTDLF